MPVHETSSLQAPNIRDAPALRERRALLLSEIERLKTAPGDLPPEPGNIYGLEREYNRLVDEGAQMAAKRHVDPLDVLPPELWGDIIPDGIDEALMLTLVSRRWCRTVLSMPQLWTTVTLDTWEEDYLAKAISCLHLSGSLKIQLTMALPLRLWIEVAPFFLASSDRISVLTVPKYESHLLLRLLSQFGSLPALRSIVSRSLYHRETWPEHENLHASPVARQDDDSLIFMQMPSLICYVGNYSLTSRNISCLQNLREIEVARLLPDTLQALSQLSDLQSLHVTDTEDRIEEWPSGEALASLASLTCTGEALTRAAWLAGRNLLNLKVYYLKSTQLPGFLTWLQNRERLDLLGLGIRHEGPDKIVFSTVGPATRALPIRKLSLHLMGAGVAPTVATTPTVAQALSGFFRHLILMAPLVKHLIISGSPPGEGALIYIQSLKFLESISIDVGNSLTNVPFPLFSTNRLESLTWKGHLPNYPILDHLQVTSLRYLQLPTTPWKPRVSIPFPGTLTNKDDSAAPYELSRVPLLKLDTLLLRCHDYFKLDLISCSNIKQLILSGSYASSAGELFEELLLCPRQLPRLQYIGIQGDFLEWDILILMLERRNLIPLEGLEPIKGICLKGGPTFLLDDPLSEILNGKFPDREPIRNFSLEVIGTRLHDPTFQGCVACIHSLRPCKASTTSLRPRLDPYFEAVHPLPARLSPYPSISLEISQWLEGKRVRRLEFSRLCDEIKFGRWPACRLGASYRTIGTYPENWDYPKIETRSFF